MATLQVRIDRSMRLLGLISPGVSPTTEETATCLIALNAMLDSWRNEKLMCYTLQDQSVPLAATNNTRTVGPTGNLVTTRPVKIEKGSYVIYGTTSVQVTILEDDEWAAIPDKTATSTFPNYLNYKATMPDGTIYLYPVPNASSTLHILTWLPVLAFTAASDTVTLPPGWEEAIDYNLAIEIAPEFEREPSPTIINRAQQSKANIKRINMRPLKLKTEIAALVNPTHSNILTGV